LVPYFEEQGNGGQRWELDDLGLDVSGNNPRYRVKSDADSAGPGKFAGATVTIVEADKAVLRIELPLFFCCVSLYS